MPFNFFQKFLSKKGNKSARKTEKHDSVVPMKHKQLSQKTEQRSESKSDGKSVSSGNLKRRSDSAYGTIIAPHVSEKATTSGKYVFKVFYAAKKPVVKKAIEEMYKVDVESINMIRSRAGFKKAIITLKKGNTISEF